MPGVQDLVIMFTLNVITPVLNVNDLAREGTPRNYSTKFEIHTKQIAWRGKVECLAPSSVEFATSSPHDEAAIHMLVR